MSLRQLRVWVAACDEPGCEARHVNSAPGDRWDAGLDLNDQGWRAAPESKQTFCPDHTDRELEVDPKLASQAFGGLFRNPPMKNR